jgi:sirohydrochlorin cobaltochelatase
LGLKDFFIFELIMFRILLTRWLPILLLVLGLAPDSPAIAGAGEPALVLSAFGTSTAGFDTYRHIEDQVKERFPGHEIRWAFTSGKVRRKVAKEQGKELKALPQTLKELKAAGFTRVAVQSLHVVPGAEWQESWWRAGGHSSAHNLSDLAETC